MVMAVTKLHMIKVNDTLSGEITLSNSFSKNEFATLGVDPYSGDSFPGK